MRFHVSADPFDPPGASLNGVAPTPAPRASADVVLPDQFGEPDEGPLQPAVELGSDWPFVDRGARLRTVLEMVGGPTPTAVVISGGHGAGRTCLAQEAIRTLRARGRRTEWVTCTRGAASISLGALAHLVPVAGVSSDPTAAWQAMAAALDPSCTEGAPVVVGIDDAHLLDDLSATLAHKLVLTRIASVVLTVRTGTQPPDVVAALWKDRLATRVELTPWTREQVGHLLTAVLGGPVESRTTEFLWRTSHGSVAFLYELVQAGHETARLRKLGGVWRWEGDVVLTERLDDLLHAEMSEFSEPEREAMELLAVGGSLALGDLVDLTSPRVVASLERCGMVTIDQSAGHPVGQLTQPLYAWGLRAQMPQATVRRFRHLLATRPSVQRWVQEEPLRVSTLILQLDGPTIEPSVLTRAARQANAAADHALAERLARAALEKGAGTAATVALAEALRWQGRHVEAATEAVSCTAVERQQLAITRMLNLFYGLGVVNQAFAPPMDDRDPATHGRPSELVRAVQSVLLFSAGRPQEAVKLTEDASYGTSADPCTRLWACVARTSALAVLGRTKEALASANRGWMALDQCPDEVESSTARTALAQGELLALELSGRLRLATARAMELHMATLARASSASDSVSALGVGSVALAAGHPAEAVRWLAEAAAHLVEGDPLGSLRLCRAKLAQAHALLGDPASARATLTGPDSPTVRVFEPEYLLAQAWTAAADHREEEAAAAALEAASSAAGMKQLAVEGRALHTAVRLGGAPKVAGRLKELAEEVGGRMFGAFARHAEAVVGRLGERLDEVAIEFESLGARVLAADATAQAAEAHTSAGNRRRAAMSAARAVALARASGGVHTPALERLGSRSLTARERQVAMMAAERVSNQGIARKLGLSVRTVETHLANAYAKLGISTRAALVEALGTPVRGRRLSNSSGEPRSEVKRT
jgi:DNA-binding CsgD family transcriptional regulator